MRRFGDSRVNLINDIIRRRAAKNGRKLLAKFMAEQVKLQAYLSHRLAELEAAALAGDQRVRDDMGASILAIVEANNENFEALVEQANTSEHAIKVIAAKVLSEPIGRPGRIPDGLNRRPRFSGN